MTATVQPVDLMPVSMPGKTHPEKTDRLLIVADPELGDVPVRWRWQPPGPKRVRYPMWRCAIHGNQPKGVRCLHTYAAGIFLAEHLLGLTPNVPIDERTD